VNSVLAVPITAGDKRLGVLSVYAVRAPIFAEDDLRLVQLLADQAAVILESRALIDEAARVQAREEATRLKDDFLSAAAHDLKTPLTGLIAQAQLLEHRARRNPEAPADVRGIKRLVEQSQRMRYLVTELLDVGRVEQGKLVDHREEVDLVAVVRESCAEQRGTLHPCALEAKEAVIGSYDAMRIRQLVDNLLDNAVKYSPDGGTIRVRVWREGCSAHITVTDQGIGIPAADLPHLFDRFHRGTNVDDRRFSGMGLGLYICRGIAEQHGGQLLASSRGPSQGSTFHVVLPAMAPEGTVPEQASERDAPTQAPVAGEPA
jgi:signal transduction histidine kinase